MSIEKDAFNKINVLTDKSYNSRNILLFSDIDENACLQICDGLLDLQNDDISRDITLIINSNGGQVYELFSIIDMMECVNPDIRTIVLGKAMSAGAVLAICGTKGKRFMTKNSRLMLHSVSSGTYGNIHDIKVDIEEFKRLNQQIIEIISERSNLSVKEIEDLIQRDRYILPDEAIKFGFIDGIIESIH